MLVYGVYLRELSRLNLGFILHVRQDGHRLIVAIALHGTRYVLPPVKPLRIVVTRVILYLQIRLLHDTEAVQFGWLVVADHCKFDIRVLFTLQILSR